MKFPSLAPSALAGLLWTTSVSASRSVGKPLRLTNTARQTPSVSVVQGNGTVQATLPSGDSVNIYLHGATVTSWKTSDGDDKILLSTASPLNGSAAIRGGIPVVFPNFGTAPDNHQTSELPSHGFARNSTWTFAGQEESEEGVVLTFTLSSAQLIEKYQTAWPYQAEMTYNVSLSKDNLAVNFAIDNKDTQAIDFQFLLHTYLSVPVSQTQRCLGVSATNMEC